MSLQQVRIIYRQVGWMKCVACSDYKRLPGQMWLGVNRWTGVDDVIACPCCKGTGQVAQFKIYDMATGKEIDYEAFGRDMDGNVIQVTKGEVHHVS